MCLWQISLGSVESVISVNLPFLVTENENYRFPGVCYATSEIIWSEAVMHSAVPFLTTVYTSWMSLGLCDLRSDFAFLGCAMQHTMICVKANCDYRLKDVV